MSERGLLSKSIEVISKAKEEGIPLRLFGGLAVSYLAPNGKSISEFSRESNDIDLFSLSRYAGKLRNFLKRNGILSDDRFNALYGAKRQQYFYGDTKVDILLDEFRMCHRISLKNRLPMAGITIPPSDLLLTKLQIYEINGKDIKDILALMHDLKMANADTHTSIDAGYIAELLSNDWGLYRTATMNLEKINAYLESTSLEPKRKHRVSEEIEYLKNAIELRPKSIGWKLRAKVGDRVRWYELPEEVEYAVPSAVAAPAIKAFEENGHVYQWMSFIEMQDLSKRMSKEILEAYGKPRAILYIERGGMVIANMLSESLGVNELYGLQMVAYADINQMGKIYILPHYITLELKKREYVLLVDDIADSGKTLKAANELFGKKYSMVVTATLAYKPRSVFKPDIIGKRVENNAWIIFDYEENEGKEGFEKSNIKDGLKLLEYAKSKKQVGFDEIKGMSGDLSRKIIKKEGPPAAILYMTHSGLIIARLLSDYLSVKRVSSIIPNEYISGDYMQHVANVCSKALAERPSGYILLVDTASDNISDIKASLSKRMPNIRLLTAAMVYPEGKGHSIDFLPGQRPDNNA